MSLFEAAMGLICFAATILVGMAVYVFRLVAEIAGLVAGVAGSVLRVARNVFVGSGYNGTRSGNE